MSDELPTARERKVWMVGMLALGAVLGTALWGVAFLPCSGSPDVSTCGAQATSSLYTYCCAVQRNPPWLLISGIAAAPALILTWWWRTRHKDKEIEQKTADISAAKRDERSRRFAEALRLLAEEQSLLCIGGLYSLESLANESPEDLFRVIETICTLVRTSDPPSDEQDATLEAQEGVMVLSRLNHNSLLGAGDSTNPLQLSCSDLRGTPLIRGSLDHAHLSKALFDEASFYRFSMAHANLYEARLRKARLTETNLEEAVLVKADFSLARLTKCSLRGANLCGANLRTTKLVDCILTNAKYNHRTQLPEGFDCESAGMVLIPSKRQLASPTAVSPDENITSPAAALEQPQPNATLGLLPIATPSADQAQAAARTVSSGTSDGLRESEDSST
jgi:uncharacterized protein YjbI with pentapeptide repeats